MERTCWRLGAMAKGNQGKDHTDEKSETYHRWRSVINAGHGKGISLVGYGWVDLLLTMLWCLSSGRIAKESNDQI